MSLDNSVNHFPAVSIQIRRASSLLYSGAIIAYPTEGVWGLGCNPSDSLAVKRLVALKSRSVTKGLILVADSVDRLMPFFRYLPSADKLQAGDQPITWLLQHGGYAPDWLTGGRETLAVRISAHPVIRGLCGRSGLPLVSTSANPAGKKPAMNALRVRSYFGNLIDIIVPGHLGGENAASEIRDFQTGKILRQAG